MLFCSVLKFFKIAFFKSFWNTIKVLNSLDPDQIRHIVGPDLGPYNLQRLSYQRMTLVDLLSADKTFTKQFGHGLDPNSLTI